MLYCQALSLALFDQGGGGGPPTPLLRPLGPSFFILQIKCSISCPVPTLGTLGTRSPAALAIWRNQSPEFLGLNFALPPASCSDQGRGHSSPGACLPCQGTELPPPQPPQLRGERQAAGVKQNDFRLLARPLAELPPLGLARRCQACPTRPGEALRPSRASHGKRWVWRLQRRSSRQGGAASGFDWDMGDSGWPWQERAVLRIEAKVGRVVLASGLSSPAPHGARSGRSLLTRHQRPFACQGLPPGGGSDSGASPYQVSDQSH